MTGYKKTLIYLAILFVIIPAIGIGSIIAYNAMFYPRALNGTVAGGDTAGSPDYSFWIGDTGPVGPLFTGHKQYPFICTTIKFGLGQPIIDNEKPGGSAVFPELFGFPLMMLNPIGYSDNCSIYTRVDYFYYSKKHEKFIAMFDAAERKEDMAYIEANGKQVPFIVRLERGTINRFIYGIAMLAPHPESLQSPQALNNSGWNKKLVYKFQGGIGIGRNQGRFSLNKLQALHYESLRRGYAVAYSSGTRTSTQYNLRLAEETALMVKRHFIAVYGEPLYTVGIGASGGGIQQYVIAQNNPNIIDAAIPQASYPDMITETVSVADCELLERYFDAEYQQDPDSFWGNWQNRMTVQGLSSNQTAVLGKWRRSPAPQPGASECVAGWRGTVPNIFNPFWTHPAYAKFMQALHFPEQVYRQVKWTHWNDLQNIYPPDAKGFSANSWDNVGVQYGLQALRDGDISKRMFLDLNACVGGWKQPTGMRKGDYPWDENADPENFDPWDQANMNLSKDCKHGKPAPRTHGDVDTMRRAYSSGHVFTGAIDIPIIDVRWYLEPVLNIHHSRASFSARARIQAYKGNADNHIIWIAQCTELDVTTLKRNCVYEPTGDALDVIDEWMRLRDGAAQSATPLTATTAQDGAKQDSALQDSIARNNEARSKPARAVDSCFDGDGKIIYAGPDAWDGILNGKPSGPCSKKFKIYSSPRMRAGEDIKGNIFKCALMPVKQFIEDKGYPVVFNPSEIERLEAIFPEGVCDYRKPGEGWPGQTPAQP